LADFFQAKPTELQNEFGLSASAADYVVKHRSEIRAQATEALRYATDLDIHILAPGDLDYPAHVSGWYDDEPPLLYARGNLDLFKRRAFAILNSAEPASASLTNTVGLRAGWPKPMHTRPGRKIPQCC
jgi:predicted Rossmann fold nucleotide-binding protein DprA/Smf involved in DNA uptake